MTAQQHVSLMPPRRAFDRHFPDACLYIRRFDIGHEPSAQFPIRLERRNSPAPGVLCIRLVFDVAHIVSVPLLAAGCVSSERRRRVRRRSASEDHDLAWEFGDNHATGGPTEKRGKSQQSQHGDPHLTENLECGSRSDQFARKPEYGTSVIRQRLNCGEWYWQTEKGEVQRASSEWSRVTPQLCQETFRSQHGDCWSSCLPNSMPPAQFPLQYVFRSQHW